ncbi:MAG: hypothetical protein MJ223_01200 [Mycoplasmoidaceae bacterium]|nr:hypothetical protein [Mycoplasmoidaceae bacterium]
MALKVIGQIIDQTNKPSNGANKIGLKNVLYESIEIVWPIFSVKASANVCWLAGSQNLAYALASALMSVSSVIAPCQTLAFLAINQSLPNRLNSPTNSQTISNGTKTKSKTERNIHHVLVLCVCETNNLDFVDISINYIILNIMAETTTVKDYFTSCFDKKLLIKKGIIAACALALILILSLPFYF